MSYLLDASFGDVDLLCDAVRSWSLDFRPLRRAVTDGSVARLAQSQISGIELAHARVEVSLDQTGEPPPGKLTFVVLENAMRRLWWRRRDADSETVLVFPIGSELSCVSGPDFNVHTVSLDEQSIAAIAAALQLDLPPPSVRSERFKPRAAVLGEVRSLLQMVRSSPTPAAAADVRRIAELLVSSWLSSMQWSNGLFLPERGRDAAIQRCLGLMEDLEWSELDASAFRQVSGLSERSLQYAFRERFGLTPAAFIKARRMAAVRRELLHVRDAPANVADISSKYGFWHVGQFASDYRRAYSELPSETLSRSRGQRTHLSADTVLAANR